MANDWKYIVLWDSLPGKTVVSDMNVKLELNRHDVWVGIYWIPGHAYICILPCIAIHVWSDGS